jgi:hypothetical protein
MHRMFIAAAGALAVFVLSSVSSHAEDLVFTLKNGTRSTMERFYTSPEGVDDWEEDVFGSAVLGPGQSVKITVKDDRRACTYDMRFEFTADSDLDTTEDTVNLCETDEYEITE